jgi:hypothetical protein
LLDLELAVAGDGVVRLDHLCAGAGMHRLLGIELSDAERGLLVAGETVTVVAACDRCIWERRLVIHGATPGQPAPPRPAETARADS